MESIHPQVAAADLPIGPQPSATTCQPSARVGSAGQPRPTWHRRPDESWQAWDRRMCAKKAAEYERKRTQPPMPLDPLYAGSLEMAVGVGCFDCSGNAKGFGW